MLIINGGISAAEVRKAVFAKVRRTDEKLRCGEKGGPVGPLVAMQPASALENQIDRRMVGYHQVEVEVQTLFDDLSRDEHGTVGTSHFPQVIVAKVHHGTGFAESNQTAFFSLVTIFEQESSMQQIKYRLAIVSAPDKVFFKRQVHLLRLGYGVADHRRTSASFKRDAEPFAQWESVAVLGHSTVYPLERKLS